MNWLLRFFQSTPSRVPFEPIDARVDYALKLTHDVSDDIRERVKSPHPFRGVLVDLLIRPPAVVDVALLADAYQMSQEARIFHGPNGQMRQARNKF